MQGGTFSIYTRFGNSECPKPEGDAKTEFIYEGRAANSWWTSAGGGGNYLCLPDDPQYSTYRAGRQGFSDIFGVEYDNPVIDYTKLHNYNVPCAVCMARGRAALLMIPAKLQCPDENWTREYNGYLMSSSNGNGATTFECVDVKYETIPGSATNTDGGVFYNVEARCDNRGLDCPPYNSEKELTCVVCTR